MSSAGAVVAPPRPRSMRGTVRATAAGQSCDRLARVAQPHREQVAGDQLTGQAHLHVPEVDLRLRPGPVGLRNGAVTA